MKKTLSIWLAILILFVSISTTIPVSAAPTMIENGTSMESATKISVGKEYVTFIDSDTPRWFKFTTSAEDAYYHLSGKNISIGTNLNYASLFASIYTNYGEEVFWTKHNNYSGLKTSNAKLEPNTTYYVCIHSSSHHGDGNFRFKIQKRTDTDEDEKSKATAIKLNSEYQKTLAGTYDEDWFSFTTGSGTKYVLYTKNLDVITKSGWNGEYLTYSIVNKRNEEQYWVKLAATESDWDIITLEPKTTYYVNVYNEYKTYDDFLDTDQQYLLYVGKPEITKDNVEIVNSNYVYNGIAKKPKVTVIYNNTTLTAGKDYTCTYSNNTKAGKATVTVTGKGDYIGTVKKTFTIAKKSQKISGVFSSYTKLVGGKFRLNPKGTGKITYSVSNKKVATVSSAGVVTLVGAGKTTITVKAAGSSNVNAVTKKITITVNKKSQKITGVSTAYTKTMGSKFRLSPKGIGKITYSVSNKKVAKVSNTGVVTLIGAGKVTITIKAAGNGTYKSVTKKITLTVKPKTPAKVSKISTSRYNNGKVKVTWNKVSGATGYQISKSTGKNGTVIVASGSSTTTSKLISAKKGVTCYYKVRAVKKVNGITVYGSWSPIKTCR